jgi:hypothetical protein
VGVSGFLNFENVESAETMAGRPRSSQRRTHHSRCDQTDISETMRQLKLVGISGFLNFEKWKSHVSKSTPSKQPSKIQKQNT